MSWKVAMRAGLSKRHRLAPRGEPSVRKPAILHPAWSVAQATRPAGGQPAATRRAKGARICYERFLRPMPIQHLLVVEDDPRWREQLSAAARAEGCEVALAADGLEALAYLREHAPRRPQLVLLDLLMPRMDGWELYGHMRQERALREIPVLMMSAAHMRDLPLGGVVGILHKPSQPEALLPEVRERLRRHGMSPDLPTPREAYSLHVPPEANALVGTLPAALRHAVRLHLHRAAELAGNELPMASNWLMAMPGTPPSLLVTVEGVRVVLDVDEASRTLIVSSVLPPPELRRA